MGGDGDDPVDKSRVEARIRGVSLAPLSRGHGPLSQELEDEEIELTVLSQGDRGIETITGESGTGTQPHMVRGFGRR
ncbi:hypothetical protein GCM10009691_31590 [Brevibacterium picturae]|uniref:Uncharacterized protein n=1 Tax=Brevibacterium picturae TaxID=260553 RepID=A0ABN2C9B0_9MICO